VITEKTIFGTGGGIFNMLPYITDENFIVLNCDVVCDIDLVKLMDFHNRGDSLATMVMQDRDTFNQVVIDSKGYFCGINLVKKGITSIARDAVGPSSLLAFCGIHAVNKNKLSEYRQDKIEYSIIDVYLNAAKAGGKITAYEPLINWFDVGTIEKLHAAEIFLRSHA
jgi:NDP-sugar pyrophosphorylase family protein